MKRLAIALLAGLCCMAVAPSAHAHPAFGDGTQVVGVDIQPGTYRTRIGIDSCYWERLSGFGGSLGEIISNDFTSGPAVVTIGASDAGFTTTGCADWSSDLSAITDSPTSPFGAGTYIVGVDIAAGTWRAATGDGCYWARLSGFSGSLNDVSANDFGGSTVVTIRPSDRGFTSSGCGTWSKIQ